MLSRTASNLYWMARFIERAENTARVLDVTYRMSLVNRNPETADNEWFAPLHITGTLFPFQGHYSLVCAEQVLSFMALDRDNPSSIIACAQQARENARSVRVNLTTEMWEVINGTWLELQGFNESKLHANPSAFFDWVKERSHLFRGVTRGTMHRSEATDFLSLGTFIERTDNTARILDVKYHVLLPSAEDIGRAVDYYQWGAVLRSLSAFETYKRIYRDVISPQKVAELMMLSENFPRSLLYGMGRVLELVESLAPGRRAEVVRQAGELYSRLRYARIQDIFNAGLHEYVTDYLDRISLLATEIDTTFFTPPLVAQETTEVD